MYDVAFASDRGSISLAQLPGIRGTSLVPVLFLRPCRPSLTIGGRLTRRTDVFGDDEPSYRPVKGEPVFLWDANGRRTGPDSN